MENHNESTIHKWCKISNCQKIYHHDILSFLCVPFWLDDYVRNNKALSDWMTMLETIKLFLIGW
jgi:hypothetical protein